MFQVRASLLPSNTSEFSLNVAEPAALRPTIKRRDSEAILSYYQSDLAGKTYVPGQFGPMPSAEPLSHTPKLERSSSIASSSSAYSSPSSPEDPSFEDHRDIRSNHAPLPAVRRRPSKTGGSISSHDSRRIAIVVDRPRPTPLSLEQSTRSFGASASADTLPLERRVDSTTAFDRDHNDLSSPSSPSPLFSVSSTSISTAPTTARSPVTSPLSPSRQHASKQSGVHRKTSSRDIGIVGTRRNPDFPSPRSPQFEPIQTLTPPIFQTPQSRSPSPHAVGAVEPPSAPRSREDLASNSAHPTRSTAMPGYNGAGVAVPSHYPSSAPVSMPNYSSLPSRPHHSETAPIPASAGTAPPPPSYLYYQPGVHATAGPPPPPPRAMFDIDFSSPPPPRPPRLRSPSPKQPRRFQDGTATPPSVAAVLSAESPQMPSTPAAVPWYDTTPPPAVEEAPKESTAEEASPSRENYIPHHVREGAFPPSAILVTPPEPQPTQAPADSSVRLVGKPSRETLPGRPESPPDVLHSSHPISSERSGSPRSWISPGRTSIDSRRSDDSKRESTSELGMPREVLQEQRFVLRSKKEGAGDEGYPSSATSSPRKGVLTSLKRFSSLPKTPSIYSESSSPLSRSPSIYSPPPRPIRIRSKWPDAMWCKDIVVKKNTLDRAIGYALKINELSMYECGLEDWVVSVKERGNVRSSSNRALATAPTPHPGTRATQPRHTSRASISSEATFPLRPDAYTATDLAPRAIDTIPEPNAPPPTLPYPSLAVSNNGNNRLSAVISSPSSVRSLPLSVKSSSGGFFSSLGRNYSLKKDEKRSPQSPAKVLTKLPPANHVPAPRPVQINNAPQVPGGPRAAPGRMQRSQTLMLAPPPPKPEPSTGPSPNRRRSNTLKRPSIFARSGNSSEVEPVDPDFAHQVDKLSDLLPHADRDVLAGYLRRAGQDILAIGQYLEDEKSGHIRRD
ncbi:hypothetical protein BV25DRAFT_1817817 [Artomyces pyxidatus]|uniref:Uncharacterized protein n=1 Tax=Artomyces pyxidatus TaxID=48021 RepID=A0ACB8TKF6_9AGAM|nr:hypothetical protein BV25DRAFT_1817817 [Artomyces pyxidatus]